MEETSKAIRSIFIAIVYVVMLSACSQSPEPRIWDEEPGLWELAQGMSYKQSIPRENPQPVGLSGNAVPRAINLCNPELKASLWGPTDRLTVSLGKTDVWDRRLKIVKLPHIDEVREACFSPANADKEITEETPGVLRGGNGGARMTKDGGWEHGYGAWEAYEFPCAKPVGQFILMAPDLGLEVKPDATPEAVSEPEAIISYTDALIQFEIQQDQASGSFRYLPMKSRNIIAVEATMEGLTQPVGIRLFRHKDTNVPGTGLVNGYDYSQDTAWNGPMDPPECGHDGEFFWVRQDFPGERTFPDGFYYYLVGKLHNEVEIFLEDRNKKYLGTLPRVTEYNYRPDRAPQYERIREAPGWAVTAMLPQAEKINLTAYVTVVTSAESDDPLEAAKEELRKAEGDGFDMLLAENRQWYKDLYDLRENGRMFNGDTSQARTQIPQLFQSWWAIQGMSKPVPSRYENDENYIYMENDRQNWHGLPCYNEYYETELVVKNQPDRLQMWAEFPKQWLPGAKKCAREMWGLPGMFFTHGYFAPVKSDEIPYTIDVWEWGGTESPMQILKMGWDVWDYGGDIQFLEDYIWEPLKELAIFYSAYVTMGEDGFYHAIPSMAVEHWGMTYQWKFNKDALIALSAIRWTLRNAIETANFLERDQELIPRWQEVLDKIVPYPTSEANAGTVFAEVAGIDMQKVRDRPDIALIPGNTMWSFAAPHMLGDDINLDSDPELIELQYRTCRSMIGRRLDKTHILGKHPDKRHQQRERFTTDLVPIADNDELYEICMEHPERMLNSRSGRMHFFPCVPSFAKLGFKKFLARGGFEVTAECINGITTYTEITARRDNICRVANPWPERTEIRVSQKSNGRSVPFRYDDHPIQGISFQAESGKTYLIQPK